MPEPPGDEWLQLELGVWLMRSQLEDEPAKLTPLTEDRLQEAMDRAAAKFFDPTRPQTPPTPDFSSPNWRFLLKNSRRT